MFTVQAVAQDQTANDHANGQGGNGNELSHVALVHMIVPKDVNTSIPIGQSWAVEYFHNKKRQHWVAAWRRGPAACRLPAPAAGPGEHASAGDGDLSRVGHETGGCRPCVHAGADIHLTLGRHGGNLARFVLGRHILAPVLPQAVSRRNVPHLCIVTHVLPPLLRPTKNRSIVDGRNSYKTCRTNPPSSMVALLALAFGGDVSHPRHCTGLLFGRQR